MSKLKPSEQTELNKEILKKKKAKRGDTVLPGERDEDGRLKTPHTKYGVFRNVVYIMEKMWQYKKVLILFIILGSITKSIMAYLWSYIAKYVIEIVEIQAGYATHDIKPLLQLLAITTAIEVVCIGTNTLVDNRTNFNFIKVRMKMITERIDKVLSMDYQTLEQPWMLDMFQRAANATGGNYVGVEGVMRTILRMGALVFTMIVSATAIISLDPILILALIAAMAVNYLSYLWSVKQDKEEFWDKMSVVWRRTNYMERCTQDYDYAKDIRLFSMKKWLLQKQDTVLKDYEQKHKRSRNFWLRHSFIYSHTNLFSASVMYFILIREVLGGGMTIGDFTLYLGLCYAFSGALSDFYAGIGDMQRYSMQTDDFRTVMDYPSDEVGEFYDINEVTKNGEYHFEFKNVSFRYEEAENYALKNLNLSFPAGQRLAVVGLNGAGKTTFIKLLLRLYDVTEGEILLNGINIKKFRRADYYKLFSPVFQNVELFAFPMAENISMKEPENTDKELALDCALKGGLEKKLENLDKGIDTELLKFVHDDGVDLSGGEKQKLALARALYKGAPVIVLDEPTAALDALAEYELYQNFDRIVKEKSAVYISHRLSSTRFCDAIAMFANGEMVEYGTHEELLAKKGAYAEMFEVQAQYYEVQDEEK